MHGPEGRGGACGGALLLVEAGELRIVRIANKEKKK